MTVTATPAAVTVTTCSAAKVSVAVWRDIAYLLTPCCGATGKGSDSPTGVVCRSCYATVPGVYGSCEPAADSGAVAAMIHTAVQGRCPCPSGCAEHMAWQVEEHATGGTDD